MAGSSSTCPPRAEDSRSSPHRDIVYAPRGDSFQESTDGGLTWSPVNDGSYPEVSITDCVLDPTDLVLVPGWWPRLRPWQPPPG